MVDMNCDIYEDEEYIMMKYGFWGWNSFCTDDLQVSANRTLCWTSEEWKASIWIWQTLLVNFICHHQCGRHHHFHWKWNASILLWHPSLFLYNMLIFSYQIKVEVASHNPPCTRGCDICWKWKWNNFSWRWNPPLLFYTRHLCCFHHPQTTQQTTSGLPFWRSMLRCSC